LETSIRWAGLKAFQRKQTSDQRLWRGSPDFCAHLVPSNGITDVFCGIILVSASERFGGLNKRIQELEADLKAAKRNLEDAGRFTVSVTLQLPDQAKIDLAHLENLECRYYLHPSRETPINVIVDKGIAANSVKVKIADISPNDVIWRLELRERASDKLVGVLENEYPLGPTYKLK